MKTKLIDADNLLEKIKKYFGDNDKYGHLTSREEKILEEIKKAPSVDAIVLDEKAAYVKLKSIPNCCAHCPIENVGNCLAEDINISEKEMNDENSRPSWCPIIVGKENR